MTDKIENILVRYGLRKYDDYCIIGENKIYLENHKYKYAIKYSIYNDMNFIVLKEDYYDKKDALKYHLFESNLELFEKFIIKYVKIRFDENQIKEFFSNMTDDDNHFISEVWSV